MLEEARELIAEAKSYGLASVVWSYPRDGDLTKQGETSLDISAYATHMAALIGAHFIKVKLPSNSFEQDGIEELYKQSGVDFSVLSNRVKHIKQCALNGRRIVIFSGGGKKVSTSVQEDAIAIAKGGGNGSIIGRNSFQREKQDAGNMLQSVINIYRETATE